ncbi:MAG: DegT/DnrJ/EryC1/StrS family aminotransferase [Bdellovibrionales bacterium]|nr:DegT/DnrJ/EryC1/StrS family aminotransferase [Bdellovibrionales bacterium]
MNIPFVDLRTQYDGIKSEIKQAIESVFEEQAFIQGPIVEKFSNHFCEIQGIPYGIGCSNGTSAITAALRVLGVGPGDEVILPTNTFFATAEAVVEVGGKPVLCECKDSNYSVDVIDLESRINSRTRAIMPVHLYGLPAEMDELEKVAKAKGLYLIEDSAQAHLAKYKGRSVGTFGDFATFSFYPGKNLGAYGDAGFIASQHKDNIDKVARYIDHGRSEKYLHSEFGTNFRMDAIQAAVLNVKLKYIKDWTLSRQKIARIYDENLLKSDFKVLENNINGPSVYHLYVVEVSNREDVMSALKQRGISTGIHYPVPLHLQPAFKNMGYRLGDFPIAEKAASRMMSLPIFPEMTQEQQEFVTQEFLSVAKP